MTRTILLAAALLLPLAGCRKPQPSPEYAEAIALHARLYVAHLDDAYLDPQMSQVEDLLKAVPASSSDHRMAQELLAKIARDRVRVTSETETRQKSIAEALRPSDFQFSTRVAPPDRPPDSPPEVEALDAGSAQPVPGMTLAEFTSRFSGCFQRGEPIEVLDRGALDAYELKDIANCRDRHPGFAEGLVLIEAGKVLAQVAKKDLRTERRYLDGGIASDPPGSPASDAGR